MRDGAQVFMVVAGHGLPQFANQSRRITQIKSDQAREQLLGALALQSADFLQNPRVDGFFSSRRNG